MWCFAFSSCPSRNSTHWESRTFHECCDQHSRGYTLICAYLALHSHLASNISKDENNKDRTVVNWHFMAHNLAESTTTGEMLDDEIRSIPQAASQPSCAFEQDDSHVLLPLTPTQIEGVVFVAIDFENLDEIVLSPAHKFRSEIGIAILDTEIFLRSEDIDSASITRSIQTRHYTTGDVMRLDRKQFHFGHSKTIDQTDIRSHIESVLPRHSMDRNIILVGHSISNDFEVLRRLRFDLHSSILGYLDTQLLAAMTMAPQMRLELLMERLGLHREGYHNAGNDAHFTLLALIELARTPSNGFGRAFNNPSPDQLNSMPKLIDLARNHTKPIPDEFDSTLEQHWSQYFNVHEPHKFEELPRNFLPRMMDPWRKGQDYNRRTKRRGSILKPGYFITQVIDPELKPLIETIEAATTLDTGLEKALDAYEIFRAERRKRKLSFNK